jgi:hypothetical protein
MCCSLEKGIKTRCLMNPVLEIAYNTEALILKTHKLQFPYSGEMG